MNIILWPLLLSVPIALGQDSPGLSSSPAPSSDSKPSTPLPINLSQGVPACAQSCLQRFIADNYESNVCSFQNFNCLCSTSSSSGYTLGEGSLLCLVSSCPNSDYLYSSFLYQICDHIPGALPHTHPTLTATQKPLTTDTNNHGTTSHAIVSSSILNPSSSGSIAATASQISPSSRSPTSSASPSRFSTSVIPASSSSTTSATAVGVQAISASPTPRPLLTTPQIAGVTVATVGAAAVVFGFCLVFICARRRKGNKRRHSEHSFVGDKVADSYESSPDLSALPPYGEAKPRDQPKPPRPSLSIDTGSSIHSTPPVQPARASQTIGLAIGSANPEHGTDKRSPITPSSFHTSSELLPDRPGYNLVPAPLRLSKGLQHAIQTAQSPYPLYNPDRYPTSEDDSQAYPGARPEHRSLSDPFYAGTLESYRGITPTSHSSSIRRPPPAHHPNISGLPASPVVFKRHQPNVPPDYPPVPPIDEAFIASIDRTHSDPRRSEPGRQKSTTSSRYTYFSNGSDTSFEDADDADLTPPKPLAAASLSKPLPSPTQQPARVQYRAILPPSSSPERSTSILERPRPSYRKKNFRRDS